MKQLIIIGILILLITIVGCNTTPECIQEECPTCDHTEQDTKITELENKLEKTENFNKYYQKAKENHMYALIAKADAEYMYEMWSAFYDEQYYADSITFCETARESYSESNSKHQSAIEYFKKSKPYAEEPQIELIEEYINYSDISIEINWAMYEACEYFESASNYYSKGIMDTGHSELENANKKITNHDNMIRELNEYAAKINLLEEEI